MKKIDRKKIKEFAAKENTLRDIARAYNLWALKENLPEISYTMVWRILKGKR